MGADLISYNIVLPAKGTAQLVAKEVKRLRVAFNKIDRSDVIENENGWDFMLNALGIKGWDYENDLGGKDADRLYDAVYADLEMLDEGFSEQFSSRDSASTELTIGGKRVVIMYAGEMSWGDTPEGEGYKVLSALWRLGIGNKLQDKVK